MSLNEYKDMIKKAKTKEELSSISYKALREDDGGSSLFKPGSLYNKVIECCVVREIQLEMAKK